MWTQKNIAIAAILAVIVGGIVYFESQKPPRSGGGGNEIVVVNPMSKEEKQKQYTPAKEITSPDGFVNTPSIGSPQQSSGQAGQATTITIKDLIGKKVVLIDFWTFSCINCQRTIPYLNAWYKKYKDQGLEIIGVHTPEFPFEEKYENVAKAVKDLGIEYPVVLDNDYSTWNAYENRYWPRKYLIDIDGFIVYDHIGEGAYEATERKIQEALAERAMVLGMQEKIVRNTVKPEDTPDVGGSGERSPEIYFGAARNTFLGNGASGAVGVQTLEEPVGVKANILYLAGGWEFTPEFAQNISGGLPSTGSGPWKIIFRYRGKDLHFVAGADKEIKVKILVDGKPLGGAGLPAETQVRAGESVQKQGGESFIIVKDATRYGLIRDAVYGEHTLELIIESPGLEAYTFTFG